MLSPSLGPSLSWFYFTSALAKSRMDYQWGKKGCKTGKKFLCNTVLCWMHHQNAIQDKRRWEKFTREERKGERDGLNNMFSDFPQDQIQQARYYIKVKLFRYEMTCPFFFLTIDFQVQKYYFSGKDVNLIHNRISTTSWERSISSDSVPSFILKACWFYLSVFAKGVTISGSRRWLIKASPQAPTTHQLDSTLFLTSGRKCISPDPLLEASFCL